jgi:hypothetical protein
MERINREEAEQLAILSQQMTALLAQKSAPPPPPLLEKMPDLQEELQKETVSRVRALVDQEVTPALSALKSECEKEIMRHKAAVYEEFWKNLQKPLKMSEAISLILDGKGM